MGTKIKGQPDRYEESLKAAHALMRQGKGEESCRILLEATELSVSSGLLDEAALYSSVRGSYLVAMGRDSDALQAYIEAERYSQEDVHYRLTTARHLVFGMGEHKKAIKKLNAILESPSNKLAVQREAHAIRGLALLALDQAEKAIQELEVLCMPAHLPSLSWDLTLAEELSRRQLAPDLCRRYLELVESKAREENETRVLKRVLDLQGSLESGD